MDEFFVFLMSFLIDEDEYSFNILQLAGIHTVNDIALLDEKTIRRIETYFTNVKYKLSKEEQKKFLDDKKVSFSFPPGMKRRMLEFSKIIKGLGSITPNQLQGFVSTLLERIGVPKTKEINRMIESMGANQAIAYETINVKEAQVIDCIDLTSDDVEDSSTSPETNNVKEAQVIDCIDLTNDDVEDSSTSPETNNVKEAQIINCIDLTNDDVEDSSTSYRQAEESQITSNAHKTAKASKRPRQLSTSRCEAPPKIVAISNKTKDAQVALTQMSTSLHSEKRGWYNQNIMARKSTPIHNPSTSKTNDNFIQPREYRYPTKISQAPRCPFSSSQQRQQQQHQQQVSKQYTTHASQQKKMFPAGKSTEKHQAHNPLPINRTTENRNSWYQNEKIPTSMQPSQRFNASNNKQDSIGVSESSHDFSKLAVNKFRMDNKELVSKYNLRNGLHFHIYLGSKPSEAIYVCLLCKFEFGKFNFNYQSGCYSHIIEHIKKHVDKGHLEVRKNSVYNRKSDENKANIPNSYRKTAIKLSTSNTDEMTAKQFSKHKSISLLDHLPFMPKESDPPKHTPSKNRKVLNTSNHVYNGVSRSYLSDTEAKNNARITIITIK